LTGEWAFGGDFVMGKEYRASTLRCVPVSIRIEGALSVEHASVAPLTTSLAMRSLERTLSE
jgi:hypothetical protein